MTNQNSPTNILLLEEEPNSLAACRKLLAEGNFQLTVTSNVDDASRLFGKNNFHILFIHVAKFPSPNLDFCKWVRSQSVVPIVLVTDRSAYVTEEMGLEAGADDYIVRPVSEKIIYARVSQQLERSKRASSQPTQHLEFEILRLDLITHIFTVNQTQVMLTATEFLIMRLFMKQAERVFTREQILETIGIGEGPGTDHIINSHISRLRIKVRNNGGPEVITVIRNMGYKFANEKKTKNFKLVVGEKAKSFTLIPSHEESD